MDVMIARGSKKPIFNISFVMDSEASCEAWKQDLVSRGSSLVTRAVISATLCTSTREYTVFLRLSKHVDFFHDCLLMETILIMVTCCLSLPIWTTLYWDDEMAALD